jgi:hypothetical protein
MGNNAKGIFGGRRCYGKHNGGNRQHFPVGSIVAYLGASARGSRGAVLVFYAANLSSPLAIF